MSSANDKAQISYKSVAYWVHRILDLVNDGEIDKFYAISKLNQISKTIDKGNRELKTLAVEELEESQEASTVCDGYSFKLVEGRKSFDFSNDPEWQILKNAIEKRESDMKNAHNAYLKTQKYYNADGEEVPVPALKPTKSYLRIEKSKE